MAEHHNLTLDDEKHRVFRFHAVAADTISTDDLSGESGVEIKIRCKTTDGVRLHFLDIKFGAVNKKIPLTGAKVPPNVG